MKKVSRSVCATPTPTKASFHEHGHPAWHFEQGGWQFVLEDPRQARPFDNFLWNDAVFSCVQHTGVGTFDYEPAGAEGIQLYTGVGRICDFDVFGRSHLMSRLLYVRDNETGEFWALNWEPVCHESQEFRCVHEPGCSRVEGMGLGIRARACFFVPDGSDMAELWLLRLENPGLRERAISLFAFAQFQMAYKWGFDSYGDMIFRSVAWLPEDHALEIHKHPFQVPHAYLRAWMTSDRPADRYDGSWEAFAGVYGTLARPEAVVRGACTNSPGSAEATIGVLQFNWPLRPGEVAEWEILVAAADTRENLRAMKARYLGRGQRALSTTSSAIRKILAAQKVHTPEPHLDTLLNIWVPHAVRFGATWCRWGWKGYRDIVQHAMGVASLEPQRTRSILMEALGHQNGDGTAPRGWNPLDEKPYSDSALWLIFALAAYLKETGDKDFCDEPVPFRDAPSAPIRDHITRALDFLENHRGRHGLCLIKYGDWNDSLTAVGARGRGESVWLTLAYAEALLEASQLFSWLGEHRQASQLLDRRQSLLKAVNTHAWDGRWYVRCFDDDGRPVGSSQERPSRMFLEPQAWAFITGAAQGERALAVLAACDEWLSTPCGYSLLAPAYTEPEPRIGRLSCLEPGVCENGTVYSHVNIWMVLGMLRQKMPERAWELFKKFAPGMGLTPEHPKAANPPYMFANCYYGPSHRRRPYLAEFTWITGSVSWVLPVMSQHFLGVKPTYDGLVVEPCLPRDWKECQVERLWRGTRFVITIRNPHGHTGGHWKLFLDGGPFDHDLIPHLEDGETHHVEAILEGP